MLAHPRLLVPWRLSKPTYRSHLNSRCTRSRHSRRIFHCYRSNVGVSHETRGVLARARARERGIEGGERERERNAERRSTTTDRAGSPRGTDRARSLFGTRPRARSFPPRLGDARPRSRLGSSRASSARLGSDATTSAEPLVARGSRPNAKSEGGVSFCTGEVLFPRERNGKYFSEVTLTWVKKFPVNRMFDCQWMPFEIGAYKAIRER